MSPAGRRILWAVLGAGVALRLALAFAAEGVAFDIESFRLVSTHFDDEGFGFYGTINAQPGEHDLYRWPYPPGFLPWIGASVALANLTGLPFHGLIQLPPIAADAAIAWLVQDFLRLRGAGERQRLVAAALVALGPSFFAISGYHGQIDALAILPAVAALWLWERPGTRRRALVAGALIGAGAAIKTAPILVLLALLPSARSRREGGALVAWALAVPLAALAPFLVADPGGVSHALRYSGAPGLGGPSLAVQPSLAQAWLAAGDFELSALSTALAGAGPYLLAAGLGALLVPIARRRPAAVEAAALLWLTVYVLTPSFFMQYMVWGLPFFLMAGAVRRSAAIQLVLVVPLAITYLRPVEPWLAWAYAAIMLALWAAFAVALAHALRALLAGRSPAGP